MQSYQNLKILQNLYRLKALGFSYIDPFEINQNDMSTQAKDLASLTKQIESCHLCDFSKSRSQSMPGFGSHNASVMFIDHTVSEMEDSSNAYLGGRSGEMLKNMIRNVLNLSLDEIFYTHTIKCKPLQIQKSYDSEWLSCRSYLLSQIDFIEPKVIVTLGPEALLNLTGEREFEKMRGHRMVFKKSTLVPIYHPNFLLRNPNMKKIVYNDLKTIKSCL